MVREAGDSEMLRHSYAVNIAGSSEVKNSAKFGEKNRVGI